MNTLKKSGLLLLLACLCACGREENLAAQNKPKQKTVKEVLCREWKLVDRVSNNPYPYNEKDTFGIIFYADNTFLLKIEPTAQESIKTIKGKWEFENPMGENFPCYEPNGLCTSEVYIKFSTDIEISTSYYSDMFNTNKYSQIARLYSDTLVLYPPRYNHHDIRSLLFSLIK